MIQPSPLERDDVVETVSQHRMERGWPRPFLPGFSFGLIQGLPVSVGVSVILAAFEWSTSGVGTFLLVGWWFCAPIVAWFVLTPEPVGVGRAVGVLAEPFVAGTVWMWWFGGWFNWDIG